MLCFISCDKNTFWFVFYIMWQKYLLIFLQLLWRPFGYERVYLPLYKVANTPFHTQEDDNMAADCLALFFFLYDTNSKT